MVVPRKPVEVNAPVLPRTGQGQSVGRHPSRMACTTCNGAGRCLPRLRTDCHTPPAGSRVRLSIRHGDDGTCADRAAWRWRRAVAASKADLGRPPTGDTLACGFASRDGVPSVLFEASARGDARCARRACWRHVAHGFTWGAQNGALRRLRLGARSWRHSALEAIVAGPGVLQAVPRPGDPVTLRVETPDGACWSVTAPAP